MPDSFSELRHAGGSNKPWVAAGVFALALALIGVALAGAYWTSQPGADTAPATVTVTAQPSSAAPEDAPVGTYSGTFNNQREDARRPQKAAWPVVATFGAGTATVTYPRSGCTTLIDASLHNLPLTKHCSSATGADNAAVDARWEISVPEDGLVELTYFEGEEAIAGGTLSRGIPDADQT
ncbi:hypothetical protein [Corynebacterium sp. HMSC074A01]|uniref:hypothetical protein n=1 Tax=Corynebacterium sp. HMSC074A01 TaxID=1715030 RepID=UPI0008A34763|nr:hypothetical protein [Corynebacterium sp. HMSC074A01]OHF37563.1 hypothetical protein HMPREF2550_03130 [Corynebacterium sp. HMSC074A01]